MDDRRYLLSLIKEGEHQQQDFKYKVTGKSGDSLTISESG